VRALAELVRRRADGEGVAADAGSTPLVVQRIGVAHVEIRRGGVGRVVVAVRGQVQPGAVALGEAVLVASGVGRGLEAELRVVGQVCLRLRVRATALGGDRAATAARRPEPAGAGDMAARDGGGHRAERVRQWGRRLPHDAGDRVERLHVAALG